MKRRVVFAGLVLFALWPLAHHALVLRYDINPWKLFGWSMYCVPATYVRVLAFDPLSQGDQPLDLAPAAAAEVEPYIHRRWVFGKLLPPDSIAAAVFAAQPDLTRLELVVDHLRLNRETSYYGLESFPYVYERSRSG